MCFFQQLLRPSIHTSKSVTKTYRGDISQYLRVGHTILIQPQMPAFVKWCNEVIVHIFYNIYNNLRVVYWITLVSHIWVKQNAIARLKAASDVAMRQCNVSLILKVNLVDWNLWRRRSFGPRCLRTNRRNPSSYHVKTATMAAGVATNMFFYLFTTVSCHPWIKQSNRSIPIVLVSL